MLPLDDPRWRELDHRGRSLRAPSFLDLEASEVAVELAALLDDPSDLRRFQALWPYLCSEGTAWPAAHAAAPYVVEIARRLPPADRLEHLDFLGLTAICTHNDGDPILPDLRGDYEQALADALPLLAETLLCPHDRPQARNLLIAAAAIKGHPKLGDVIDRLDSLRGQCPRCDQAVYPDGIEDIDR